MIHSVCLPRWGSRGALGLLGMLVGATGCAQLLGADDYAKQVADAAADAAGHDDSSSDGAESGTETRVSDAGAGFDPKPPYYSGPDCTACIEERCRAAEHACDEEGSCASFLQRAREARSHEAPLLDVARDYMESEWALNRGEPNGWNVFLELQRCVRQRCTAACELGRDLACVGNFDWPTSFPETTELRFRIVDGQSSLGLDGLRTRACPAKDYGPCPFPLAQTATQDGGFVSLVVDLSMQAVQWRYAEFGGSVLIDGNEAYPPYRLQWSRPLYAREYFPSYLWDRATMAGAAKGSGLPSPADNWSVTVVYPFDCRYDYMKGITLEVWKSAPGGLEPCTRCVVAYTNDSSLIDLTLSEPSLLGVQIFVAAPTEELNGLMLVARDKSSGRPVSILRRGGAVVDEALIAYMFPASSAELAALPDEVTR